MKFEDIFIEHTSHIQEDKDIYECDSILPSTTDELVLFLNIQANSRRYSLEVIKKQAMELAENPEFVQAVQKDHYYSFASITSYDQERIETIYALVKEVYNKFVQDWHYSEEETLSELIQIFSPLGLTIPMVQTCITQSIDSFKNAIGKQMVMSSLNDYRTRVSMALLSLICFASPNAARKERSVNMETEDYQNLVCGQFGLKAYRVFNKLIKVYNQEYREWENRFILSTPFVLLQNCKTADILVNLLILCTNTKLNWKQHIRNYFREISPLTGIPETYRVWIYTQLNRFSNIIENEYKQYCNEVALPNSQRIKFEASEKQSHERYTLSKDFFTQTNKTSGVHLTLKQIIIDNRLNDFSALINGLIEDGYIDNERDLDIFVARLSGYCLISFSDKEIVKWHKEGRVLRWLIEHLCETGQQRHKTLSPYFDLVDDKCTLTDIDTRSAGNIKSLPIYKKYLKPFDCKN